MKRIFLMLALTLLLVGCRMELYSNLSEQEANQMMALLKSNQIDADKAAAKEGGLTLRVDESKFVEAVELLRQHGYPRKRFVSAEDFFPSGQLISSPVQEKTRINYLKEQSLERMLSNIEGVMGTSVVIGQSVEEAGFTTPTAPSVSVLVKYSPEVNLKVFTVQIRSLVLNAIPGMPDEKVALMLQPVTLQGLPEGETLPVMNSAPDVSATAAATPVSRKSLWAGAGIGGLIAVVSLAVLLYRRKRSHALIIE